MQLTEFDILQAILLYNHLLDNPECWICIYEALL